MPGVHDPSHSQMRNRKVLQDFQTQRRVVHLGVELQAEQVVAVADGGHRRVLGERKAGKAVRQLLHPVAVAHPNLEGRRQVVEQRRPPTGQTPSRRGAVLVQRGVSELLYHAPGHRPTQLVHHRLHAVADAQHRQPSLEHPVWDQRRAVLVDAGRATGQDDALGVDPLDFLPGVGGIGDLGVDLQFPDAAGDQVAVLGAEVNDGDTLVDLPAGTGRLGVDALGDLEVGGDFQVIAGGDPSA